MSESHHSQAAKGPGEVPLHDGGDVNIRAVLLFGLGLALTAIAIHGLVWLLFLYFSGREAVQVAPAYPLAAGQAQLPPEPRLQPNPREDLAALRAREDEILTTFGWVDEPAGIVRIPIEEAMTLIVKRGLPVRPERERAR